MKKLIIASLMALSFNALAEPSFQQVQEMIDKRQYQVAAMSLEGIIKNHPNSAKVFYTMAQAQAGLGNLQQAQYALNRAKSIDPELKFAPVENVQNLEQAITPQGAKIQAIPEEAHTLRNLLIILGLGCVGFFGHAVYQNRKDKEKKKQKEKELREEEERRKRLETTHEHIIERASKEEGERIRAFVNTPTKPAYTPGTFSTTKPYHHTIHGNDHHHGDSDGFVEGVIVGAAVDELIHSANTQPKVETRIVEREIVREVEPQQSRTTEPSSWEEPRPVTVTRSSSWDNDDDSRKSSYSSSSWGSGSSSSSSSWGDSSSSSSSSWDD